MILNGKVGTGKEEPTRPAQQKGTSQAEGFGWWRENEGEEKEAVCSAEKQQRRRWRGRIGGRDPVGLDENGKVIQGFLLVGSPR